MPADRYLLIRDTYDLRRERYGRTQVNDPHHAVDILHDLFLNIRNSLRTLDDEAKLESWLFKIAKFTIIDFYRSKKTQLLPEMISSDEAPEKELVIRQGIEGVTQIIDALPDRYRRVVRLSVIENKTAKEIAQLTGLSLSAVKSRLQRGKIMLNEKLKTCCDIEYGRDGTICDINCTDRYPEILDRKKKLHRNIDKLSD